MSGPINVHLGGVGEYTHNLLGFAQELANIGEEAKSLLSSLGEQFETGQGSVSHAEAQNMIMDGINEGQDVIMRHGNAVDNAATEFVSFDHSAASNFGSI